MKNDKLYRDYLLDDIKRLIDSNGYTMQPQNTITMLQVML